MKVTVEQISPERAEEVLLRCHDPKEPWVEEIQSIAAGQITVNGMADGKLCRLKLADIPHFRGGASRKGNHPSSAKRGKKLKKLYEKNELILALLWIVVYCVLQSLANPLNKRIGVEYSASAAFCILQAVILIAFIRKNHLQKRYGLCKSPVPACRFLYYVPLLLLASGNLWNGIALNYSLPETICRIVCMLCVGFLEEMIFRGLLFAAIAKDNVKSAIVISSVTFGIGHIINLFNGSGMELVNNLCQIVFAIAVGFLLVTIFYRGGSLLPCILVHSAINTLGTFASDAGLTMEMRLLHLGALIAITVAYTLILTRTLPKKAKKIHK